MESCPAALALPPLRPLSRAATQAAVAAAAIPEEEGVLVLDDSNFKEALAAHAPLLVEFYAPWCGHCQALAPKWKAVANALQGVAKVGAINCDEEGGACQMHGCAGVGWVLVLMCVWRGVGGNSG